MKNTVCIFLLLLISFGGAAQKKKVIKSLQKMEDNIQGHTGFSLYNPVTNQTLIEYQANRYFTPASNTKIFTLYTSLNVLGDSIPGLYYRIAQDSLIFWGTGDPSFLYENVYQNPVVFEFLASSKRQLYYSPSNFHEDHFGPGWSWGDYLYSYQVERSPMPIYGNYFHVSKEKGKRTLEINNPVFKKYFWLQDSLKGGSPIIREYGSNYTDYFPKDLSSEFDEPIPFRQSSFLMAELLMDTLKKSVKVVNVPLKNYQTIKSTPVDSLYKVMMKVSDNYIAEQLMLTCAGTLSDTLNTRIAIDYAERELMADFPDKPLWYDGSGLSRYNQFTPRTIVYLWKKILEQTGQERLFPLLATGGAPGTIKNWYASDPPFVYGKTGTLMNVHALSGYLVTDKGNVLIFSFMSNNYPGSSNDVKKEMEQILFMIKDKY